jgi:hypothetical protein
VEAVVAVAVEAGRCAKTQNSLLQLVADPR